MKDMEYYRTLDLRVAVRQLMVDSEERQVNERFHDILKAIILRYKTETFTAHDLLAYLGRPDSVRKDEKVEAWEYEWRGLHMGREYRSSDVFLLADGQVVGVEGHQ